MYLKAYLCAYVHASILNVVQYTCTCTHVYITYVHVFVAHLYILAYIRTYICTCGHRYNMHTYVCTCIQHLSSIDHCVLFDCVCVMYVRTLFESVVCFNFCQFLAWPVVSMFHMCLARNTPILKVRMGIKRGHSKRFHHAKM